MAKILIVDDNIMNCKMAVRILEPLRMQIDIAENGKIALDKIQANSYDIVLMDHMMPVMDGVEAVKLLRTLDDGRYRDLPVVALSAGTEPETADFLLDAGMNDFVAKPIDAKQLRSVIQKWLPRELVIRKNEWGDDAITEATEESAQWPVIDGINVEEGVKNSGGFDFFISLLGIFYQLIDTKSQKIVKCIADGMIKDYTVEVHALKNTARMIGALELSQEFEHLEQLGNAGDAEGIKRETPHVLEHYLSYKCTLQPYGALTNQNKKEVPMEELIYYLQGIQDATAGFDLDCADDAFAQLEEYKIPTECEALMDELRVFMADVDIDNIVKTTQELITRLESKRE